MKINTPPDALIKSVQKYQNFVHKGKLYESGDLIKMQIFNTSLWFRLFYSKDDKMLMFHDDVIGKDYNVLGYLENIIT